MKQKSLVRSILVLMMVLTLIAMIPAATADQPAENIDSQISLIFSNAADWMQKDGSLQWYYALTDLDHNGRLEIVAAAQHPADRSTNLKVWEVNELQDGLTACSLNIDPDESFPDILTDNADTFYSKEADTWSYLFYDNIVLSDSEVYTIQCSVSMKNNEISYDAYAIEHTQVNKGFRSVSHTDSNGFTISPEQYNASGMNAFAGTEKSNTNFDWFLFDKASISRMSDSYSVFTGEKEPTEVFPVPKPTALQTPEASPAPTATPIPSTAPTTAPVVKPAYLQITKNPTNENRKSGETAYFVACANVYDSLSWTLVSPDGGQYSVQSFAYMFADAPVGGEYSTTLSIGNVAWDMDGWGAYCTFYYNGQTARTSTAYIYVKDNGKSPTPVKPTTVPAEDQSGSFSGYVTDYSYNTVTIYVYDGPGYTSQVDRSICNISGELYIGATCTLYYQGIGAHGPGFYYVDIQGYAPSPQPIYGSMSGYAYHDTAFTVYIVLQDGTSCHIDAGLVSLTGSIPEYGAPCTAYYTDYPSENNIYHVDIYGEATPSYSTPEPEDEGGWAGSNYYDDPEPEPEDEGGWAGSNYYDEPEPEPEDQGGWAGSNYYDEP